MKLNRIEQETIIVWNNAEDTATVYTCDARLKKILEKNFKLTLQKSDEYSVTYKIPKKTITIRYCKVNSEQSKENLRISVAKAREARKNGK